MPGPGPLLGSPDTTDRPLGLFNSLDWLLASIGLLTQWIQDFTPKVQGTKILRF